MSVGLSSLSEEECRHLLAVSDIGRVVVSVGALPAALPVNYRVIDDEIVFRTAPGTKLTAAVDETVVAFEVDDIDSAVGSGWSVLVVGKSRVVVDPAEVAELELAEIRSWVRIDKPHYVAIQIDRISGRRLDRPAT